MLETPNQEPKSAGIGSNAQPTWRSKRRFTNFYWVYVVAVIVYGLDQLTKYSIEQSLGPYIPGVGGKAVDIFGGLSFRYVRNSGASYSFLQGAPWLFTIVAILATLGLIFYYQTQTVSGFWYKLAVGLILGGIVGNLSDRLFKSGSVTDFIHVSWLPFFNYFNLADSGISIGVVIVLITTLLQGAKTAPQNSNQNE